jgi:hypothetical protein
MKGDHEATKGTKKEQKKVKINFLVNPKKSFFTFRFTFVIFVASWWVSTL